MSFLVKKTNYKKINTTKFISLMKLQKLPLCNFVKFCNTAQRLFLTYDRFGDSEKAY